MQSLPDTLRQTIPRREPTENAWRWGARPKVMLGLVMLGTLCYAWFSTGLLDHQKVEVEVLPAIEPANEEDEKEGEERHRQSSVYTEIECRFQGSYCVYSNLCFNGQDLGASFPQQVEPQVFQSAQILDLEAIMHNNPSDLLPRNLRRFAHTMRSSLLFGENARAVELPLRPKSPIISQAVDNESLIEYIWLDKPFYAQAPELSGRDCYNMWIWTKGAVPLWSVQYRNETMKEIVKHSLHFNKDGESIRKSEYVHAKDDMLLPPMEYVFNLCGLPPPPWHEGLLRAVVPPQATILWHKNIVAVDPDDLSQVLSNPRLYMGLSAAKDSTNSLGLNPRRLLCAKQAVLQTNEYTYFTGIREWRLFRESVLQRIGIDPKAENRPKVLFKSSGRVILNMEELLAICRKYTHCEMSTAWDERTPFEVQASEVASSIILIGSHGAGLTNAIFLPPHGALIELFPWKWWPDMYQFMAYEMGIYYFMVASHERPATIPDGHHCINDTAKYAKGNQCTHLIKKEPFRIPIDKFEYTLINALEVVGINAIPSTLAPNK